MVNRRATDFTPVMFSWDVKAEPVAPRQPHVRYEWRREREAQVAGHPRALGMMGAPVVECLVAERGATLCAACIDEIRAERLSMRIPSNDFCQMCGINSRSPAVTLLRQQLWAVMLDLDAVRAAPRINSAAQTTLLSIAADIRTKIASQNTRDRTRIGSQARRHTCGHCGNDPCKDNAVYLYCSTECARASITDEERVIWGAPIARRIAQWNQYGLTPEWTERCPICRRHWREFLSKTRTGSFQCFNQYHYDGGDAWCWTCATCNQFERWLRQRDPQRWPRGIPPDELRKFAQTSATLVTDETTATGARWVVVANASAVSAAPSRRTRHAVTAASCVAVVERADAVVTSTQSLLRLCLRWRIVRDEDAGLTVEDHVMWPLTHTWQRVKLNSLLACVAVPVTVRPSRAPTHADLDLLARALCGQSARLLLKQHGPVGYRRALPPPTVEELRYVQHHEKAP